MEIIPNIETVSSNRPSIITIGNFDGVHRGHQSLIHEVIRRSADAGAVPTAITFDPPPAFFFNGIIPGHMLSTLDEKSALMSKFGIERLIIQEFNDQLRMTRAMDYIHTLVNHLHPVELWVGPDFALGYKREGTVEFLQGLGSALGFTVHIPDFRMSDTGERISSSLIRKLVHPGKVDTAASLLGRPYRVTGEVIKGTQQGREIGFRTANIDVPAIKAIPGRGVYAAYAILDGEVYPSVTNIGFRPTFNQSERPIVETHLLGFDDDIYGEELSVDFVKKIRDEVKFGGIDELIAQINADISEAESIFVDLA